MYVAVLTAVLVTVASPQAADTTFSVDPGGRLDVHAFGGEVVVRTWDRDQMRVVAEHASGDWIEISTSGTVVKLRPRSRRHGPRSVDYRITIPASMSVEIGGTFVEADIEGVEGEVQVETVQGDIRLRGGSRYVTLRSVQGDVECRGARGRIDLNSVNGRVRVIDAVGQLLAETVNGGITLRQVESATVEAETANGDIVYDGTIEDDGRYSFSTHNGNISISVPEGSNASVWVSTFSGEFEATFPVTLTETRGGGKRFGFVLGDGSARIELSSFGGTIRLGRPRRR